MIHKISDTLERSEKNIIVEGLNPFHSAYIPLNCEEDKN